ncbi:MAG: aminotransferase class IV [Candidatus Eisenbacteria bacterium]|nr:aminotransferase class IV [Candidatus Eisenbacteria bacterium]
MTLPLAPGARQPDGPVWVNGRIVRGEDAALSVFDRGARDGGGIFETLRVYGREPFAWTRHMERLVLAAAELGFPVPPTPASMREGVAELLEELALDDAVARITVTRGIAGGRPTRTGAWIEVQPIGARLWRGTRRGAATAMVSPLVFDLGWMGAYKTTSRMAWDLAREQALAAGVDEALLVSSAGELLEGSASNLFVVRGREVITPPLASRVLPGVTRAIALELCAALGMAAREARLEVADLATADEVFVTNSVQEILPLARVAGRDLPARDVGSRLLAAYRERVAASR